MADDNISNDSSWTSGATVPEVVASLYYRYGLLVATHPLKLIFLAIVSFISLSSPLLYLPLPGYLPQEYVSLVHNYSVPPKAPEGGIQISPSPTPTPLWYQGPPKAYIQQVVVRSSISPWENGITVGESVRAPLFSVFHLSRVISDFQSFKNNSVSLGSECLLVEGVVRNIQNSGARLPHYNCLMLSPADLWGRDPQSFVQDVDVLRTIKSLKARHEDETSIADILFGIPSKYIGLSAGGPNDPHVVNYAITIVLKKYSQEFVSALNEYLVHKFPLHQPTDVPHLHITHIYFPSRLSLWEFLIIIFYCFLFSSIYFSVRKMQGLHSRLGLAISIMSTLISSLLIAVSISAHFGLRPLHSRGKFVYPVLAALVGFENSMALVRSVLSTPNHLDIKIRVAQGLAKEGWIITKYFLTMITIITISFFLFIPIVQEICIYGSLVLLCDLYFQLLFFTAVIAIDVHRCQQSIDTNNTFHINPLFRYPNQPLNSSVHLIVQKKKPSVENTYVPNLHRRHITTSRGEDRLAPPQSKPQPVEGIPKRLRITYFMARKRMFQRMFICTFVGWIFWLIYTSEIIEHFTDKVTEFHPSRDLSSLIFSLTNQSLHENPVKNESEVNLHSDNSLLSASGKMNVHFESNSTVIKEASFTNSFSREKLLKHKHSSFAKRLPPTHWPSMFSYYNISLRGHYLSILPPILLSLPVSPEDSKLSLNPHDAYNKLSWNPIFSFETNIGDEIKWDEGSPFIPSSRGELAITAILLIPAVAVLVYATVALYRCICSGNYAEWRSSWWGNDSHNTETSQIIGDTLPLVLTGHPYDVECLCTDGSIVVSSCLSGAINVWDPSTGECISSIKRYHGYLPQDEHKCCNRGKHSLLQREFSLPEKSIYNRSSQCSSHCEQHCLSQNQRKPSLALHSSNSSPTLSSLCPEGIPIFDPTFSGNRKDSAPPSFNFFSSMQDKWQGNYVENPFFCDHPPSNVISEIPLSSSFPKNYQEPSHSSRRQKHHSRNRSIGSIPFNAVPSANFSPTPHQNPVWCLECHDGFIHVGTGTGVLEVWDAFTSKLKCFFDDGSATGITSIRLSGNKVVVARLTGSVEILQLEALPNTHSPTSYSDQTKFSQDSGWTFNLEEELRLVRINLVKAHQQPITVLSCDNIRIITGSHDHTLKVLSIQDGSHLFTLIGHYGPVTSLALGGPPTGDDPSSVGIMVDFGGVNSVIASGAHDGSLCVWDLFSGACVYSVEAHNGAIIAITCTSSYILSLGDDDKLCVWERFQGHLLNTLVMTQMYCSNMVMLTNKLLITSQQGSLTVWDITVGLPIRIVRLGECDNSFFIKHLLPVAGSIVCDYGNQLRVVRLPVAEKVD